MPASYPTDADLAQFLAAAGLLPEARIEAGGAGVVQNVDSSEQMRVGDTLYFVTAATSRTIVDVISDESVRLSSTVTTIPGELIRIAPEDYDLTGLIAAAKVQFEREAGRIILATTKTLEFDGPTNKQRRLFIPDCLSLSSVTFLGVAIASTDYALGPQNNTDFGLPYFHLEFFRSWSAPVAWAQRNGLVLVGSFGYASTVPYDVFKAIQAYAAAEVMVQAAADFSGQGLRNWSEADVHEDYGDKPGANLEDRFRSRYQRTVANYKNLTRGWGREWF